MGERLIRQNHSLEYQNNPTFETIYKAIREEDLMKRLDTCISIIGNLCSEHRNPCMSIPCQPYDEDMFICETIKEAMEKLKEQNAR